MKKITYVIGAGFAGLTAKLYLSLANIESKIVDNLKTTQPLYHLKNFPSISRVSSIDLIENIKRQVEELDYNPYIKSNVNLIEKDSDNKIILTTENEKLYCDYTIICTGFSYNDIDIDTSLEDKKFIIKNANDFSIFKDKKILVIGAGERAAIYLEKLKNIAKKVNVLIRSDKLKSNNTNAFYFENINLYFKSFIKTFSNGKAIIFNSILKQEISLEIDYIIIATGLSPNFPQLDIKVDEIGTIITDKNQETNIKNIFAAGIVANRSYQQALNACHFGSVAATEIIKRMKNDKNASNYY